MAQLVMALATNWNPENRKRTGSYELCWPPHMYMHTPPHMYYSMHTHKLKLRLTHAHRAILQVFQQPHVLCQ